MNKIICQSCGMPMDDPKDYGTNEDLTPNQEYCTYCFQTGEFTSDTSMEEMIEICIPHMVKEGIEESAARSIITNLLPTLKRWKA